MSTHDIPNPGDDDELQVKDGPLLRSEEASGRDNPDAGRNPESQESKQSLDKWERDETE